MSLDAARTSLVPVSQIRVSEPGADDASPKTDDHGLIASLNRGNIAALDQLYLRYRAPAFATAFALLRDPGAAEDAVQDAFLNVWRAADSYRPGRGAPRGWLLTIVRNAALDQLRARHTARRHQPRLAQIAAVAEEQDDLATTTSLAAEARRLHVALATLPPAQRHALELAYFARLSHGEIARRTGTPLGTVKGRVRLGLRRLRHDLRDLDPAVVMEARCA